MKETLDYILKEIPKFLINYINIFSSPRDYVLKLIKKGKEDERLKSALIYFSICYLIALCFTIPNYGKENYNDVILFVSSLAQAVVILLLSVLALIISWILVGKKIKFQEFLVPYTYQIATVLVFYLFLDLMNKAILKYNDPIAYEAMINFTYRGTNKINPYGEIVYGALAIHNWLNLLFTGLTCFWLIKAWSLYRIQTNSTRVMSFIAGFIFFLLMCIVLFVTTQMGKFFDPDAFNHVNYGLDDL